MNSPPAKHTESDPSKRIKRGSKLPTQERGPQRISPRKNAPTSSQLVDGEPAEAGYSRALQREDIILLPRRGTKSNSSTQSRSISPVKTIYDLTMADPPITFFEANSKTIQPPAAVSQLHKQFLDVSDGFNLLPESLRVRSRVLSRELALISTYRIASLPIAKSLKLGYPATSISRNLLILYENPHKRNYTHGK
jgi:hypothetical protein